MPHGTQYKKGDSNGIHDYYRFISIVHNWLPALARVSTCRKKTVEPLDGFMQADGR